METNSSQDNSNGIFIAKEQLMKRLLFMDALLHSQGNGLLQMESFVSKQFQQILSNSDDTTNDTVQLLSPEEYSALEVKINQYLNKIALTLLTYATINNDDDENIREENEVAQKLDKVVFEMLEELKNNHRIGSGKCSALLKHLIIMRGGIPLMP